MQPSTPQRPVMDVTAPKQSSAAAPPATEPKAPALAVHNAPPNDTHAPAEQPRQAAKDQPEHQTASSDIAPSPNPVDEVKPQPPSATPHEPSTVPVGAITAAIIIMLALSGVAVAIYLNS